MHALDDERDVWVTVGRVGRDAHYVHLYDDCSALADAGAVDSSKTLGDVDRSKICTVCAGLAGDGGSPDPRAIQQRMLETDPGEVDGLSPLDRGEGDA